MGEARSRLQVVLAVVGVLVMLAGVVLGAATMRPTKATWQDSVAGEARFGAVKNAGQNYARAVAGFGNMQRQITNEKIGPGNSMALPGRPFMSSPVVHDNSGVISVLPLQLKGKTCATIGGRDAVECGASAPLPKGSGYAASEMNSLGLWAAGLQGIENLTYNLDGIAAAFRATATCRPGEVGQTSVTAGGPIVIREETSLYLPPSNFQTTADHRVVLSHNIKGTLQNHQESGPGWAKAEVRLHVRSEAILSPWTLHIVLASAECGLATAGLDELERPTSTAPANLPQAANVPMGVAPRTRAALEPLIAQVDEQLTDPGAIEGTDHKAADAVADEEVALPVLPDADETFGEASENSDTTTPASSTTLSSSSSTSTPSDPAPTTSAPEAPGPSTTVPVTTSPAASAPAPAYSSAAEPSVPESAVPTTPTEITEAPQLPQEVAVGRWFTVTGADGGELGVAKVEDIVRTPGCGVELTLSITTSAEAGPDRWRSVGPEDFAEVRPGGSVRDAQRVIADCEQVANSTTTALSPGNDYKIVIAFLLDDSARQAMLRPEGTGGWVFDLPALTRVAATGSPVAAAGATGADTSTATSTSAEEITEA